MSESEHASVKTNSLLTTAGILKTAVLRFFVQVLIPIAKDIWHVIGAMLRPIIQAISRNTSASVLHLHYKKHWLLRFRTAIWGNAVGLAVAMVSAQLITHFIEVRSLGNLWGLFSNRAVVSAESFRIISFIAEFFITLVVFSMIENFMDQRALKKQVERTREDEVSVDE